MTPKQIDNYVKNIKKFTKEITVSKKESQKFLEKTGIYTKNGKLTQNYK